MYMKLLDEETILISVPADQDPDKGVIEANRQRILDDVPTVYARSYRFVDVPLPFVGTAASRFTYANSLIVNNYVLVPTYDFFPVQNQQAVDAYRRAMPGYHVLGFEAKELITHQGAFHCVAMGVYSEKLIRLAHPRFRQDFLAGADIHFWAQPWSQDAIDYVTLYLQFCGETDYTPYAMLGPDAEGKYAVDLLASRLGTAKYYIHAHAGGTGGYDGYKPQNGYAGGYLTVNILPAAPDRQVSDVTVEGTETYTGGVIAVGPHATFTSTSDVTVCATQTIVIQPEAVVEYGAEFVAGIAPNCSKPGE
jgi:hypothetical protein